MLHTTTLPSGLRVLTLPMDSSQTVSVMFMVRGGSRYEVFDMNGISHFMEHMFFKGGEKYPTAKDVAQALDGVGGEFNAFTSYDKVAYYIKVAAQHLPLALDVLGDMLMKAQVAEDEVDRERNVIAEELNMYEDTPSRKIWEVAQRLAFGDHPLGWEIGGSKESIERVHRAELMHFRETYYRAENMIVVATGKVDPVAFAEEVARVAPLGGSKGLAAPIAFGPNTWPHDRLKLVTKKTEQAQVAWNVPAPALGAADELPFEVLSAILGHGMSSRLFTEIREKRGLCYSVRAEYTGYEDVGVLNCVAGVTLEKVDEAVAAIRDELTKISEGGVTEEEMTKGREYLKGHLALYVEDTANMADFLGHRAILLGEARTPEASMTALDGVSRAQVNAVAKAYIDMARSSLAIIGPYDDAARFEKALG